MSSIRIPVHYFVDEDNKVVVCRLAPRQVKMNISTALSALFDNGSNGSLYGSDSFYISNDLSLVRAAVYDVMMTLLEYKFPSSQFMRLVFSHMVATLQVNKNQSVAVAKCLGGDTFDVETGKNIAYSKLMERFHRYSVNLISEFHNYLFLASSDAMNRWMDAKYQLCSLEGKPFDEEKGIRDSKLNDDSDSLKEEKGE